MGAGLKVRRSRAAVSSGTRVFAPGSGDCTIDARCLGRGMRRVIAPSGRRVTTGTVASTRATRRDFGPDERHCSATA